MISLETLTMESQRQNQLIQITDQVRDVVRRSHIQTGHVMIITAHCTTGIMANESLECLEQDILDILERLVPEDASYLHARYLHSYGACGGNTTGHVKGLLTGNHNVFPVNSGDLVLGKAQDIYFCEYDGPQVRQIYIEVMGE